MTDQQDEKQIMRETIKEMARLLRYFILHPHPETHGEVDEYRRNLNEAKKFVGEG